MSHPLCCTAGYQRLTLFFVLLATSVSPSLLYCWLPVSPPLCCTAGYQCHVSSTSQALEVTKDTNSGVFVVPIDTSVSPSLLYCWLPASHPLCCTAGYQRLTLFVVLLATCVSPSLLYCWLPASHPLCCTAGCQCLLLFVVLLATSAMCLPPVKLWR